MEAIQSVVILGAGNIGSHIGKELKENGFIIAEIYSRNPFHAQQLASELGCEYCDNLSELNAEADLYIFAVKDDALEELSQHIYLPGKIVVHTSGAAETNKLSKISQNCGVFYPLQTFSKSRKVHWQEIPICVESENKNTLQQLKNIGHKISGNVLETTFLQRKNLHLAAVFVNNFTNHLLQFAYVICEKNALDFNLLKPLAIETIEKAFAITPQNAQTGPAIRGDEKTIISHKKLLENDPAIFKLYEQLTVSIQENTAVKS